MSVNDIYLNLLSSSASGNARRVAGVVACRMAGAVACRMARIVARRMTGAVAYIGEIWLFKAAVKACGCSDKIGITAFKLLRNAVIIVITICVIAVIMPPVITIAPIIIAAQAFRAFGIRIRIIAVFEYFELELVFMRLVWIVVHHREIVLSCGLEVAVPGLFLKVGDDFFEKCLKFLFVDVTDFVKNLDEVMLDGL